MAKHIDEEKAKAELLAKKKKKEKGLKTTTSYEELNDIKSVEILRTGIIRGKPVSTGFIDKLIANTKELMGRGLHTAPGKLGHDDDQLFARMSGLPATGWVESLRRDGDRLIADFKDMPNLVLEALEKKLFKKISSEVWFEVNDPETGRKMGPALRAVAFLGADIPEIKGLRAFLAEGLEPLKLAEGDYDNMDDITINIKLPEKIATGQEPPTMTGFVPTGKPTIVDGPEFTAEGLEGEDLELFREAEIIAQAMKESGIKILEDSPTVDSLMRWVGSVGDSVCFSNSQVRSLSMDPARLCSWLQERAKERGLLRTPEEVTDPNLNLNEEETQVTITPEQLQKLSDELKESEGKLATAIESGKGTAEKLAEMKVAHDKLVASNKAQKLSARKDAVVKFKEAHKETLIPALHPAFDALCEAVALSDDQVVVKLSDTQEEKHENALALLLKFAEDFSKAKVVKLGEHAKGNKKKKDGTKVKGIAGATQANALDEAAMELIHSDKTLSEIYAKNKNEAYVEACTRVLADDPDINEEDEA